MKYIEHSHDGETPIKKYWVKKGLIVPSKQTVDEVILYNGTKIKEIEVNKEIKRLPVKLNVGDVVYFGIPKYEKFMFLGTN